MLEDWFSAGNLIATRLEEQIPELGPVREIAALGDIGGLTLNPPSAFVCWAGDSFADTSGKGEAQIVQQKWHVVLAVRSAFEAAHGKGVISLAGPLVSRILQSLSGWNPSPQHRPLHRVESIESGSAAGFAYYPLTFTTAVSAVAGD